MVELHEEVGEVVRGGEVVDEGVYRGAGEVVRLEDGADVGADCGRIALYF